MGELSSDLKPDSAESKEQGAKEQLLDDAWKSGAVDYLDKVKQNPARPADQLPGLDLFSSAQAYRWPVVAAPPPPTNADFRELQRVLESTHQEISELRQSLQSNADENEQARRALVTNPAKMMTASAGLAVLSKTPGLATTPLVGLAGLQGYDDFRNLLDSKTCSGCGKYALGMAADTALATGSLSFLIEKVPAKFKTPLLVGGLVGRVMIDLLPNEENKQ